MRLQDVTAGQRALLAAVTRQISRRLEAGFTDPADLDGPTVAIHLRERGRRLVIEIPETLLIGATTDAVVRESFRVRVKARRDLMLFRVPPPALPKNIEPAQQPGYFHSPSAPRSSARRGRR